MSTRVKDDGSFTSTRAVPTLMSCPDVGWFESPVPAAVVKLAVAICCFGEAKMMREYSGLAFNGE